MILLRIQFQLITKFAKMWITILMHTWCHIQKTAPSSILVRILDGKVVTLLIWWTVHLQLASIPNFEFATTSELYLDATNVNPDPYFTENPNLNLKYFDIFPAVFSYFTWYFYFLASCPNFGKQLSRQFEHQYHENQRMRCLISYQKEEFGHVMDFCEK